MLRLADHSKIFLFVIICVLKCTTCDQEHDPNYSGDCKNPENYIAFATKFHSKVIEKQVFLISMKVKLKHQHNFSSYAQLLLLLGGDIETHPGPNGWYSLANPNMCGYVRAALHQVFTKKRKLVPLNENDLSCVVEEKVGFHDMQKFFGQHFDAEMIDWKLLTKNMNSRFVKKDKEWGQLCNISYREFYEFFSPKNWIKLTESEKSKHSAICNECQRSNSHILSKFPSKSNVYHNERMNIENISPKAKKRKISKSALMDCTNKLSNAFDDTYNDNLGTSFRKSFKKCHNW